MTIQGVDQNNIKYISHDNTESTWVAPDGSLRVPESNLDLLNFGQSAGTLMDIVVRGVGVGLTHTENLIVENLKPESWKRRAKMLKKNHLLDKFLNPVLIYQTTIQTMLSSRTAISHSRNARAL